MELRKRFTSAYDNRIALIKAKIESRHHSYITVEECGINLEKTRQIFERANKRRERIANDYSKDPSDFNRRRLDIANKNSITYSVVMEHAAETLIDVLDGSKNEFGVSYILKVK